jgi:hypothetical protein
MKVFEWIKYVLNPGWKTVYRGELCETNYSPAFGNTWKTNTPVVVEEDRRGRRRAFKIYENHRKRIEYEYIRNYLPKDRR